MTRPSSLLALLLLLPLAACPVAGGDDDDAADDDDVVTDPCEDYEAPSEFDDMNDEEKWDYMNCVVVPAMRPAFQEFDAERYADFGCDTCHGEDREERDHAMPNPDLYEIQMSDFPFSSHPDPELRAFGEFMGDEVVDAMADLLGRSRQQSSPDYFGCFDCHP